jgi:hypothetical protein
MPALREPRLEKFSQELAAALNNGMRASEAAVYAGVAAEYPAAAKPTTFAANCRKRAQRHDVTARVAELRAPGIKRAEEAIGITTEYLLAKLDNLTNYNIDDYLTAPDRQGRRFLDIAMVPREALARISELSQDVSDEAVPKGKPARTLLRTKIKGYGVIDGIRLMAQIKGLMAPEKRDLTVHATDQMTDDELARIAAGGGQGNPPAPVNPA